MTTPMSVSYRFTLAFESYLLPCSAQRRLQFLFAQRGADEEFLPGAGAQGDGFPAVLRGDGDVHADFSAGIADGADDAGVRSEEHTSELQSLRHLVCRLL